MNDTYHYVCCGCGALRIVTKPEGEDLDAWRAGIDLLKPYDLRLMCPKCTQAGRVPLPRRNPPHENKSA